MASHTPQTLRFVWIEFFDGFHQYFNFLNREERYEKHFKTLQIKTPFFVLFFFIIKQFFFCKIRFGIHILIRVSSGSIYAIKWSGLVAAPVIVFSIILWQTRYASYPHSICVPFFFFPLFSLIRFSCHEEKVIYLSIFFFFLFIFL